MSSKLKVLRLDENRKPWERQSKETDRAWAAFQVYRDLLPAERSYDAAYRKSYTKPPHRRAPKWYRMWAKQHDWKVRTETWDRHLDDIERAAIEQERMEWRDHRRKLLRGFLTNVATAMKKFDPTNVSIGQLTQAVQMVVQEMRAEMDDLPTERRDVTSGGEPITITTIEVVKDYGDEPISDN